MMDVALIHIQCYQQKIATCLKQGVMAPKPSEEKMTLNTSQAEPVAANTSTAYGQFLYILPLSHRTVINGTAPGARESNFSQNS